MMTRDDKRHGTTTQFAALDVKSGMVIGDCLPRHRAKEFLRFLRRIDRAVLMPRDVHLVLDSLPRGRHRFEALGGRHAQDAAGQIMAGETPALQAA